MQARTYAPTETAKQMGLSDREALQFAKDTDRECRQEEREAETE